MTLETNDVDRRERNKFNRCKVEWKNQSNCVTLLALFVALITFLTMVGVVSANSFNINTTSDGSTKKNLVFNSSGNITVYIKIPKSANITNATIAATGLNATDFNGGLEWGDLRNWTIVERPDDCAVDTVCSNSYVSTLNDTEYYATVNNETVYKGSYSAEIGYVNDARHVKADASIDIRKHIGNLTAPANLSFYNKFSSSSTNGNDYYIIILNGTDEIVQDKQVSPGNEVTLLNRAKNSALPTDWTYETYNLTPYLNQNITIIFRVRNTFVAMGQRWDVVNFGMAHWFIDNLSINPYSFNYQLIGSPNLDVGNDGDLQWSYVGDFNTNLTTSDFSGEINDYLSANLADANGDILVPFVFNSSSKGNLQIEDINITFTDDSPPIITNIVVATSIYQKGTQTIFVNVSDNTTYVNSVEIIVSDSSDSNTTLVASLYSGDNENGTYQASYSNTSQLGNYSLIIQATDAANNSINSTSTMFVVNESIDVGIVSVDFPSSVYVGESFTAYVGVKNNGSISSSNNNVSISLNNPTIFIKSQFVDLLAGESKNISFTVSNWSSELKNRRGTHYVSASISNNTPEYTTDNSYVSVYMTFNISADQFFVDATLERYVTQIDMYNESDLVGSDSTSNPGDYLVLSCPSLTTWCEVRFHYNLTNLTADGKDPTIVSVKKFNSTSGDWYTLTESLSWVNHITVNTSGEYVSFNASSFGLHTIEFGDLVVSSPPPSSSGSSGGGGGGGGTTTVATSEVSKIDQGAEGVFSFQEGTNNPSRIEEISIIIKKTVYVSKVTVAPVDTKPTWKDAPPKAAYQYLTISSTIPATYLEEVTISFKVENTWLEDNNINPETVTLFRERKNTKAWDELQTIKTKSDSEYTYYSASTPGFSYFVITGDEGSGYSQPSITTKPPETTAPPTPTQAPTSTPPPTTTPPTTPPPTTISQPPTTPPPITTYSPELQKLTEKVQNQTIIIEEHGKELKEQKKELEEQKGIIATIMDILNSILKFLGIG